MPISFASPSISDRAAVTAAAAYSGARENDASFVNLYLLREKYGTEIAFSGAQLLRRYRAGFRAGTYGFPLGEGNLHDAIRLLCADAAAQNQPLRLTLLTAAQCELLRREFPDCFTFSQAEDYTEYLYLRENLAEMRGSRYHGKRNHMSQFWRACPEAYIQPLIPENAAYALEIEDKWLAARSDPQDPSLQYERSCIAEAAANMEALGLSGLLLYADGQPVGMTMVSEISAGCFDVHFEKVIPDYPHAWPVVANEMAKCLTAAEYLNREEDLGENGMRTSKQSYRPDLLNEKFIAEWHGKESDLC